MWLVSIVLVSTVRLSLAQSDGECRCVPYFVCNNFTITSQCETLYEECCWDNLGPPVPAGDGICGVRGKRDEATGNFDVDYKVTNFAGDSSTTFGEFPWMVAILKVGTSGDLEFLCGGSVIYPNTILTTAHTISGLSATELRVKAGVWNTTDILESDKHQDHTVSATIIHSGFDKFKVQHDVALLMLSEPLEMTDNVKPICLPAADTVFNRTACIATGWGASNSGNKSVGGVLKMVQLPLVDSSTCQEEFRKVPRLGSNFVLHNSFVCAGHGQNDTCTGDGGGPLVCPLGDDPGKYVQIGITSWGIGCGERPGAYASVLSALEWIEVITSSYNRWKDSN